MALPDDALFRQALRDAQERAQKPTPDLIRQKQAEFERRNAARLAKEATND